MSVPTFDEVMARLLANVSDEYDKREGAVIYDALAPAAREFVNMYADLEKKLDNTFAGTAEREWLIKKCAEIGIAPTEATYAVRKGVFTPSTVEISIGERFILDTLTFAISEKLGDGIYALTCETKGIVGNYGTGTLLPVQYVSGLETATMTGEVLIYGEDEESTEDLRQRYFDTLPTMTLDGNVAQYSKWCREYAGIGNYKIFPEWNGKNTVKCSILSSENTVASPTLIENFQDFLDPPTGVINDYKEASDYPQGRGLGMGKAPIGAICTVTTATERVINVNATVILRAGYEQAVGVEQQLTDYLKTLNYVRTTVSYVAISAVFANNDSIDVALDISVNGTKANIELGDEEIAKLGTVTITVEE